MWLIPTKKEVKKEFDKIQTAFKERDAVIDKLKERIETNSLKIATLEGSYLVLSQKSQASQSHESLKNVSGSLRKSQDNFETKLIKRIRNNKKSLVMAEIVKLIGSHSVIEVYEVIVKEKGLCSKASFYRYLASLKSQKLLNSETKPKLN